MRRFTDQSFGAPAAGRSRLAAAPRPPMTTLRRDGIGRPDELECIIVIAVLLEGTCNASVRAFCARGHRTLVRSGSYQRMSRRRLFAMIKSPRRLARVRQRTWGYYWATRDCTRRLAASSAS